MIAHSSEDQVTNPEASAALVERLKSQQVDASFEKYEVAAHNPANSSVGEEYADRTINWLNRMVGSVDGL